MTKIYVSENNEKIEADEITTEEIIKFQSEWKKEQIAANQAKIELFEMKKAVLEKIGLTAEEVGALLA